MKFFINNVPLVNGNSYPGINLSSLQIGWFSPPNTIHTLLMYDLDAPYPENPTSSPYNHLLITNIPGSNISAGQHIFDYLTPSPPSNSKPHRYIINLYAQKRRLPILTFQNRANFPIDIFVQQNELFLRESETLILDPQQNIFFIVKLGSVSSPIPVLAMRSPVPGSPNANRPTKGKAGSLMIAETTLSESEQKYCDCVIDVATKQPGLCNLEKAWFQTRDDKACVNPYSICAKSTQGSNRQCNWNYDYDKMNDIEVIAFCNLNSIPVTDPFNREGLMSYIKSKYG